MDSSVVFSLKSYQIGGLLAHISDGSIALPDLQRPFVWKLSKVRDLIDSIYKGLPIGSIVLWEIDHHITETQIGVNKKPFNAHQLIIDGQQRLTSLFSIIKNTEIISQNIRKIKIKIAFNPIEERFEVSNPALENSPEWISDISLIFSSTAFSVTKQYLERNKNNEKIKDENLIINRIARLGNIINYPISVVGLSSNLDPEDVSEIFVRINSKGQPLTQSDFILTLMSVYWPEGRDKLEEFCKKSHIASEKEPSSYNIVGIKPIPANLIRTVVGYSFTRGKLKYAYLTLKGRDFENRVISEDLRIKNFEKFKEGEEKAINLTNWHDFIKIIHSAGFINEKMISSKVAFYVTYALYLIGKYRYSVSYKTLESLIKKWFVFSLLTSRYTGSPESIIEEDLKTLDTLKDLDGFVDSKVNVSLTSDFWTITLPDKLKSSLSSNYAFQVYNAAMIYLDTNVLFSTVKLKDYLGYNLKLKKSILDVHHIFPKKYLRKLGYNRKLINQVANLIYLEYKDNILIGDKPPSVYWPKMMTETYGEDKAEIYEQYDLPFNFYEMDYEDFLEERRKLMALKIKKYFEML